MNYRLLPTLLFLIAIVGCNQRGTEVSSSVLIPDVPERLLNTQPNPDRPDPINLVNGAIGHTITEASIIDTREFEKQIARSAPWEGELLTASMFRPQDPKTPELQSGPANNLTSNGRQSSLKRVVPRANFPGITQARWNPPDPTLAVGPNHIIEMVNSELAFFLKDGTMQFQQTLDSTGNPGFFESEGAGDFCVDPRCFYDHYANRFVIMALEVYFGIDESYLTIAISDDDDPNGIWYKYRVWGVFDVNGSGRYWADYPSFGFDANGYYITGNLFSFSFSFGGVGVRTIDKTPMLTGQPVTVNDTSIANIFGMQMAQHFGDNSNPYMAFFQSGSQLVVSAILNPFTNPTVTSQTINIPFFDSPPSAPNNGGNLDTVDSRVMNLQWRDGKLWACHCIRSTTGGRAICRWYQVEVGDWPNGATPTLEQTGDIDIPGQYTFFPAIYSNSNGNVGMVFGKSRATEFASINATGRLSSDPPGTMGDVTEFVVGTVAATSRFGDYFDIALDPSDNTTFWMVGEISTSAGWTTAINSFTVESTATVVADSVSVTRGNLVSGSIVELSESDDSDVSIRRSQSDIQSRTEMEIKGISPIGNPGTMEVTLEGSVFARSTVVQSVELFNYDADSWEQVDSRNASRFSDAEASFTIPGDVSRFVQPGTNCMEARVRYQSDSPRQQFSSNTDLFSWVVGS